MTSPSSSVFLVLLLLSHLFAHQTYVMRKLPGSDMKKEIREPSMDASEKVVVMTFREKCCMKYIPVPTPSAIRYLAAGGKQSQEESRN